MPEPEYINPTGQTLTFKSDNPISMILPTAAPPGTAFTFKCDGSFRVDNKVFTKWFSATRELGYHKGLYWRIEGE